MDMPWHDRSGRFSGLRAAAFALVVVPALLMLFDIATGGLGAEPATELTHRTGDWAIRLLIISLAITPLRRITGWGRWIIVRRMLGLGAFFYALAHFFIYIAEEDFNLLKVGSEIVLRIYLTIGFVALLGLALLAATSTDRAIRRMGANWHRLHTIVYGIAVLAVVHFFLQSKADVSEAVLMAGFFVLLMGWRAARRAGFELADVRTLLVVAVLASLVTAGLEALWYALATGVDWRLVLWANIDGPSLRPAAWILLVGLAAALLPLWRMVSERRMALKPSSRS